MKKRTMIRVGALLLAPVLLLLSLFACAGDSPAGTTGTPEPNQTVEPVGTPPDELRRVVEDNLFYNIVPFSDHILKIGYGVRSSYESPIETTVTMMDLYGETIASCTVEPLGNFWVQAPTATSDGGFLFVLGYTDYQIKPGVNASSQGFASRVVKCDAAGNIVFDTTIDQVDGDALTFCLERDGRFYLFGSYRKPENRPNYGETDVFVLILSEDGEVVRSACFGGSDFDCFYGAELTEDGFLLQVQTQSTHGDFPMGDGGRPYERMEVELNDDLSIKSVRPSERQYATYFERVGEKDGKPIYRGDSFFDRFDAGSPRAYFDYGDYYLIVSQVTTGQIMGEPIPERSSVAFYTETVYSGYDREGNLLFRYAIFP